MKTISHIKKILHRFGITSKEIAENTEFYQIALSWFEQHLATSKIDWAIEVGGGLGLVSQIGLYLGNFSQATIIDQYMSDTAIRLMKHLARNLEHNLPEFIIAKLNEFDFTPHKNTVLVGVHCCGSLTDDLINLAIRKNVPFAVIPCCHKYNDPLLSQLYPVSEQTTETQAELIDLLRLDRVRRQNYQVELKKISQEITPKNRILLGYPRSARRDKKSTKSQISPKTATRGWGQLTTARMRFHHLNQLLKGHQGGQLKEYYEQGGNKNDNIRLVNTQGKNFILRIIRTNNNFRIRSINKFEREKEFYDLVKSHNIPIPKIFAIDGSGIFLKDVFMLMECLPGVLLDPIINALPSSIQEKLFYEIGVMLARIHQIQLPHAGFLGTKTGIIRGAFYATHLDQMQVGIDKALNSLKRKQILSEPTIAILRDYIASQYAILERAMNSRRLFHGDFNLSNLLVMPKASSWQISGLLDAEYAAAGDPGWDWMSWEFDSLPRIQHPRAREIFFQGYGQTPNLSAYRVRALIYRLIRSNEYRTFFQTINGKSMKAIEKLIIADL